MKSQFFDLGRVKALTLLFFSIALSQSINAQLYSGGNNLITGNRVGIGSSSPSGILEIYNSINLGSNCLSCTSNPTPSLRFSSAVSINNTNLTNHTWDFKAESKFYLKHKTGNGSWIDLLQVDDDQIEILTKRTLLSPFIQASSAFMSGTQKYQLGLGVAFNGSSYTSLVPGEEGVLMQSSEAGELKIFAGVSTGTVSGSDLIITSDGNVGVGTENPTNKFQVSNGDIHIADGRLEISSSNGDHQFVVGSNGYVRAREIQVDMSTIPDYVFSDTFNLMPISELRVYIDDNHHLPNIPSAAEYEAAGGVELGELTRRLLEKEEELTLYILQLESRLSELENQIKEKS